MPISGTTMIRRQLGQRLRQLRHATRKTETDVEEANIASRVKLWRIETGKVAVKVGDVRGLCWLYETDIQTTDDLTAMALSTNDHQHWEQRFHPHTESWLYLAIESIASAIRIYAPDRIPTLLQTPTYFQTICSAIEPDADEDAVHERTKLHEERQTGVLAQASPPRLTVVLTAEALSRPVGGRAVMHEQVSSLRDRNRSDCIDIRVLAWDAGAHPAIRVGAFTLMDFHNQDDPSVTYIEALTGARYTEKPREISEHRQLFSRLYDRAVPLEMDRTATRG